MALNVVSSLLLGLAAALLKNVGAGTSTVAEKERQRSGSGNRTGMDHICRKKRSLLRDREVETSDKQRLTTR